MPPDTNHEEDQVRRKMREALDEWEAFKSRRAQRSLDEARRSFDEAQQAVAHMAPEQRHEKIREWTKAIGKIAPAIALWWFLDRARRPRVYLIAASMVAAFLVLEGSPESDDQQPYEPPVGLPYPEPTPEDTISPPEPTPEPTPDRTPRQPTGDDEADQGTPADSQELEAPMTAPESPPSPQDPLPAPEPKPTPPDEPSAEPTSPPEPTAEPSPTPTPTLPEPSPTATQPRVPEHCLVYVNLPELLELCLLGREDLIRLRLLGVTLRV